ADADGEIRGDAGRAVFLHRCHVDDGDDRPRERGVADAALAPRHDAPHHADRASRAVDQRVDETLANGDETAVAVAPGVGPAGGGQREAQYLDLAAFVDGANGDDAPAPVDGAL